MFPFGISPSNSSRFNHAGKSPSMRGMSVFGASRAGATTSPAARIPLLNARTENVFSGDSVAGWECAVCATAPRHSAAILRIQLPLTNLKLKITFRVPKPARTYMIRARVGMLNVCDRNRLPHETTAQVHPRERRAYTTTGVYETLAFARRGAACRNTMNSIAATFSAVPG